MESVDLELGELFDRDAVDADEDGEDVGAHPGPGNDADEAAEGDEVLSNLKKLTKGAAKKKVMRPQPKLDAQRLKTERGLPALPKLFKDVQFAGVGHEARDLKVFMSKLEHWAHRLFPKLPFDDFIERLEKVGAKKEIQTCVKRIRFDMPMLDTELVSDLIDDDKADGADDNALTSEEAFDRMMQQQHSDNEMPDDDGDDNDNPTVSNSSRTPDRHNKHGTSISSSSYQTPSQPDHLPQSTTLSSPLSAEQQQRIERNRQLAIQKRLARLAAAGATPTQTLPQTSPDNTSSNTPLKSSSTQDSVITNSSQQQQQQQQQQGSSQQSDVAEVVANGAEAVGDGDGAVVDGAETVANGAEAVGHSVETMQTFDEIVDAMESEPTSA